MKIINKIVAASVIFTAAQGMIAKHAWPSDLTISSVSVIAANTLMFPHDLNPNRKLKYPSVTKMHLSFLSIGDNDEKKFRLYPDEENIHAVYTFNLEPIMQLAEPWYHRPDIIAETETGGGFSGNANKKHITGIFRGELLQQSPKSGLNILKRLRSQQKYAERKFLVRDLKPTSAATANKEILLADEKGLSKDEKILIRCRKLMNFDYFSKPKNGEKFALLDYYDEKNTPLVELVSLKDHRSCDEPPIWSIEGVFPRFSPTGKFLAIVQQVRNDVALNWQLQIHDVLKVKKNGSSQPILKVDGVSLYDIRTDVFKYLHSFSWIRNKGKEFLYFKEAAADKNRQIGRISCTSKTCRLSSPLRVDKHFCLPKPKISKTPTEWKDIIWVPSTDCDRRNSKQSMLDRIVWFSPFKSPGGIGFAAQVIVKHQEGKKVKAPWLTRIAILSP